VGLKGLKVLLIERSTHALFEGECAATRLSLSVDTALGTSWAFLL